MKKITLFSICLFFISALFSEAKATTAKINEFLANPSENDKEFVEIYSQDISDFSNYYLKDKVGTKKIFDTFQSCGNYYVWELSTSSGEGYLNNTGEESIFLYDPSDNLIDSYENWSSPEEERTLGRIPDESGSFVENEPTKCATNQQKTEPTPTPTPNPSPSPTPTSKSTSTPKASAKASPKASPIPSSTAKTASANTQVLGESNSSSDSGRVVSATQLFSNPPQSDQGYSQPVSQKVAAILIGAGAILVGFSFMSFMWYKRNLGGANINKEKDRFEENKQEQ